MGTYNNKLYLITKDSFEDFDVQLSKIEKALQSGVDILQFRAKNLGTKELVKYAESLRALTLKYNVTYLINDRIDIAMAVNADGVHLGTSDMPIAMARQILGPDKIIGATAKTVETAKMAKTEGADYLGVGALFTTSSKSDALRMDFDQFKKVSNTTDLPVYGIGGITLENVSQITDLPLNGVAVISGILDSDNVEETTKDFKHILG